MGDICSPLSWTYFRQDEGIEELRHYLLYTTELEAAVLSAKEEITRRDSEIVHFKELLSRAVKERNEAQSQCQKLILEKNFLQQQLLQIQLENQHQQEVKQLKQEATLTCCSEDEPKARDSTNNLLHSPDINQVTVASHFSDPILQQSSESELPEEILKLAADKPLPEKGNLLQAVKDAGPLLQNLLLAGPLPQWQNPPPQLDSFDIPPVTISSPRLIQQDSFSSSFSSPCLSRKRILDSSEAPDSTSSPDNKYQKVVHH